MNFENVARASLVTIKNRREGNLYSERGQGYHAEDRPGNAARIALGTSTHLMQMHARDFFLGMLRSFSMTPKERMVMEAAARFFNVRSKHVSMPKEDWAPKFYAYHDKLAAMYLTALAVIERGEACTDEQFCTARCFRLVNTGGFSDATMKAVQAIVDRAAKLLDEHGFGQLCYGDMNITQTVAGNSRFLAFYTPNDDRMYVRANLKGVEGAAIHTIVHELGHRLDHVFVTAQGRSPFSNLYFHYGNEAARTGGGSIVGGEAPKVGDVFMHKGEKFIVIGVDRKKVKLKHETENVGIQMSVDGWKIRHGGKESSLPFPSNYAKTTSAEFFAEMFAGYVLGTLDEKQKRDFAPLIEKYAQKPGMLRGSSKRRQGRMKQ